MSKYELVKQEFTDRTNKSWAAEYADTIGEETMGEYPTVGMAATFRAFLIKEKKYGDEPTGLSSSTAFYIREKVERVPAPDPVPVYEEVCTGSFSTVFIPNTEGNRKNLSKGETYITVFLNATTACRSIYRGDNVWANPETEAPCTNEVAYFATSRVFDMAGFPGWEGADGNRGTAIPEPAQKPRHGAVLQFQGHTFNLPVEDAMRLKALLESFISGATVLVSPSEAAEEV